MHISTKEHIISVALLHHNLSLSSLQALYEALRARFAYFEIVLLNPTLESENNPPIRIHFAITSDTLSVIASR
ncbi:hypothetical protein NYG90_07170 [Helicobacter sp. XJK30-2]|uniref:Uncharacterized protein n=1 Tax=Helicobacter zhangjianzhongii TaxID=2974574 RepID=A0ACC6FT46_9HELI|nr:hypothetical protein [Helicobacter sp. XJK30-2]MDL0082449.1 hypothetical protein [Helicobacter sp. XJK30-2]